MANKELTALPAATLSNTAVLYLVDENNNSRKATLADLAQWIKTAASIVPASNPWKGARVRRTSDLAVANATAVAATWQVTDIDTNAFWSASAPTRLTIPANVTKVRLTSNVRWASNASGMRQIYSQKNGATFHGRLTTQHPGAVDMNATSSVISVVAGDYFELGLYQTSGAAVNLTSGESTWFQIEVIEG